MYYINSNVKHEYLKTCNIKKRIVIIEIRSSIFFAFSRQACLYGIATLNI